MRLRIRVMMTLLGGRERGSTLAGYSGAKERVEACVKALMGRVGILPSDLSFMWSEFESPEAALGGDVETLRVCLKKYWSTLIFTKSEMQDLEHLSERIFTMHKDEILDGLRRLKGLSKPLLDSECPERWVAGGDAFPGEPA